MDTGFLHGHTGIVMLFLAWYTLKVVLLLLNSPTLEKLQKFKMVDAILGTLILVTGGYLIMKAGHPETWMMVKIGLVLVLIPLGIVAMRKKNKALAVLGLVGFFYIYGVAETRSLTMSRPKAETATVLYQQNCVRCHGENGADMKFGALNLQTSTISKEEVALTIKNGRGAMPKLEGGYSDEEINQLADYVMTLRK